MINKILIINNSIFIKIKSYRCCLIIKNFYCFSFLDLNNNNEDDNVTNITFSFKFKFLYPFSSKNFLKNENNYTITWYKKNKVYSKDLLVLSSMYSIEFLQNILNGYIKLEKNLDKKKNLKYLKIFFNLNFFNNNKLVLKKTYIKKKKSNKITYIRTFYRNKIAQIRICKKTYLFTLNLILIISNEIFFKNNQYQYNLLLYLFLECNNYFKFFNSNHIVQKLINKELAIKIVSDFSCSIIPLNDSIYYLGESIDELNLIAAIAVQEKPLLTEEQLNKEQLWILNETELSVTKYNINLKIFYENLSTTILNSNKIITNYIDAKEIIKLYRNYHNISKNLSVFTWINYIELRTHTHRYYDPENINKVMQQHRIINHLQEKNLKTINVDLDELNYPLAELNSLLVYLNNI